MEKKRYLWVLVTLLLAVGCASTPKHHAHHKSSKPKNYAIAKNRDINQSLLHRGQRVMAGPALDEY